MNDACMNAFSVEQGNYMNTILSTSRASLLGASNIACSAIVSLSIQVIDQQNPTCSDDADGLIIVEASGGTGDYTYTLNNITTNTDGVFTDLDGGSYNIEVTDDGGNSISILVFLDQPLPIFAEGVILNENDCSNDQDASVFINASGGTAPFTYILNNQSQSSNTFDNLANGFYNLEVIDVNGCSFINFVEVFGNDPIVVSIDLSLIHI